MSKGPARPKIVKSIFQDEFEKATHIVEERGRTGKRLRAAHVLYCVNEMSEEEWECLSPQARAWVSVASQYLSRGEDPPPYPDYKDVQNKVRLLQAKAQVTRAMNTRNNRKGATYRARELLLKHGMDIPYKEHLKLLEEDGFAISVSTLNQVRTNFKMSVLVLYDNDYLKREPRGFASAFKEKYED